MEETMNNWEKPENRGAGSFAVRTPVFGDSVIVKSS